MRNCLENFWILLGIFLEDFLVGIFLEDFLGEIFLEDLFGRNFFGRNIEGIDLFVKQAHRT